MTTENLPTHITVTRKVGGGVDAECGICHQGLDCGPRFGGVLAQTLLDAWLKQHAHKPKAKAQR